MTAHMTSVPSLSPTPFAAADPLLHPYFAGDDLAAEERLEMLVRDWIPERSLKGERLAITCRSLLETIDGAVDLEVLVSILARGLETAITTASEHDLADEHANVGITLEQQSHLRHLWSELRLLPRGQRVALLLNLRGADGEELMSLLPLVGIASIADIAEVLDISPQALAEIWNELPWSDHRIAELLGMTRQHVINLRQSV